MTEFIFQNAFSILSSIAASIAFIGGIMSWWGGFKQKQKYNDTLLGNMLERIVVLESGGHCKEMHARCEEERNAEMLEVARQLKEFKNDRKTDAVLIANQIHSVREKYDHNFKLLFDKQEEISIFMARLEERLKSIM